jgi:hypothetical protein
VKGRRRKKKKKRKEEIWADTEYRLDICRVITVPDVEFYK